MRQMAHRTQKPTSKMKKYEYKTITLGLCDYLDLNKLGDEGWEMCGVINVEYKTTFYFKREKQ